MAALSSPSSGRYWRPIDPAHLGADQFGCIGIFLLRHDRRAGREPIGQRNKAELGRGPYHQLFGKPRLRCMAQIEAEDRNSSAKSRSLTASSEFAAGRSKPSASAVICPVDGEGRSGQRRRPQGGFIHARARIADTGQVTAKHLDIGHHVVAPCHRLRGLQMGKARA